jgi:Do/DeqQ family serine protease
MTGSYSQEDIVPEPVSTGDSNAMHSDIYTNGHPPQTRPGFRRRAGLAAGALLLTGSVIGWSFAETGTASAAGPAASAFEKTLPAASTATAAVGYADVVEQIAPAVVTIRSERTVRRVSQDIPGGDPRLQDFLEQFGFGQRGPRGQNPRQQPERRSGGLGSGVIVRSDGYILTNHHVVEHADSVNVEMTDGRSFKAKVVGSDQPSDLAVLKIDGTNLQTLALGNSDAVRVGDVVLAVGNPLGVGQTVTMGIVSAKGRATGGAGDGSFEDFIQTDAPINQGNSGGALVSTGGELIGINSQILTPSGGNIGIGFAIPANMAKNVMSQLIDNGQVRRGMIGVTIQPVTSDIARSLGLEQVRGALVNAVTPGGPADKGGVKRGDVITAVNGAAIRDGNGLRNHVAQLQPGSPVKLSVVRNGSEQALNVTLGELNPAEDGASRREGAGADSGGFGMSVEPMTKDRAAELGVKAPAGVLVTDVIPSGKAADAGLRPGDVIAEVDGNAVATPDALSTALRTGTKPALLLVHRGGSTMFVPLERGE